MLKHIATIINPHGLDGTLKLKPNNADYDWFLKKSYCFIHQANQKPEQAVHTKIISSNPQGKFILVRFENITSKDIANKWSKGSVLMPQQELPSLNQDEYYIDDLIGLNVLSQDSEQEFGIVSDVLNATAGEFLEITREGKTVPVLIPFQSHFVHTVDIQNKKLLITGLDSFFES